MVKNVQIQNEHLRERLAQFEEEIGRLRAERASTENGGLGSLRHLRQGFDRDACQAGLPELFDRIAREIRGGSFEDLFRRWTQYRPELPGSGGITVIPGTSEQAVCNPQVVVLVRSGMARLASQPGWLDSSDPIEALKLHLETCRLVRGVLLVFEWHAVVEFDDSLRQWIRAWKSRNIAFAIGVCGPDGTSIQPFPTGV